MAVRKACEAVDTFGRKMYELRAPIDKLKCRRRNKTEGLPDEIDTREQKTREICKRKCLEEILDIFVIWTINGKQGLSVQFNLREITRNNKISIKKLQPSLIMKT